MESKDIVFNIRKSVELPENNSLLNMVKFADKVGELCFKAGEKAGEQKVVDWIEANKTVTRYWHWQDSGEWQAFLKSEELEG